MIDAHTHLFFPDFANELDAVISRAEEAGIRYFLNVGTNNDTSWEAILLARKYANMFATVGIHPNEANQTSADRLIELEKWITEEPKVVAIGEVGLDYYRNTVSPAIQRQTLISFFKMAENQKKPLVFHIRDAYDDIIKMIHDYFKPPIRGMAHCFSGTPDHAEQLVHLGLHVSFAGPVTYPKNDALREAVKLCPESRILIETDAPYLPPQSMRGKRNEPAFMIETARKVAELKGKSLDELSALVVANAKRLFDPDGKVLI